MKKLQKNDIFKSGVALFAIAAIFTLILALANHITEPIIAEARELAVSNARIAVFPDISGITLGETELTGNEVGLLSITPAFAGGQEVGKALELVFPGAQGPISAMLGVDNDGQVTYVTFLNHSETPGIGDRIDQAAFRSQFIGQSAGGFAVDAITGATASSNAVINNVRNVLNEVDGEGGMFAQAFIGSHEVDGVTYVELMVPGGVDDMHIIVGVANGITTSFEILSHNETPGIGGALAADNADYIASLIGIGTGQADTVSGATATSAAMVTAAELALSYYALGASAFMGASPVIGSSVIGDVVYIDVVLHGFVDDMHMVIGVSNGITTSFEILSHNETPRFGGLLAADNEDYIASLIGIGTGQADSVTGATVTADTMVAAVEAALSYYAVGSSFAEAESPVIGAHNIDGVTYVELVVQGAGGDMHVVVGVANGITTSFEVLSHNDSPDFGGAMAADNADYIASLIGIGTGQADSVTGATTTADAMIKALEVAIAYAQDAPSPVIGSSHVGGVLYVDVVVQGAGGDMHVIVGVENGITTSFEVVSHSDSPDFGGALAADNADFIASLVGIGAGQADSVTGATVTADAMINALEIALAFAEIN